MVVTRRSSNSVAGSNNDGETGSILSTQRRPPPPPPPPPIPANQHQQQQPPAAPAVGAATSAEQDTTGGGMLPIPEEVEINNNNQEMEPLLGGREHAVDTSYNNNNNNNNIRTIQQQPQQPPPPVQYLQVRVPPPQASRPSHIHRRRHPRERFNDPRQQHNRRPTSRKGSSRQQNMPSSSSEIGEIVKVLIPTNGFASEKQLAECLSQASAPVNDGNQNRSSSSGGGNAWESDFEDDFSLDEYFDDRKESSMQVAGMFRESDRVFIPLSIIYSNPTSFVGEILCLKRPAPPKPKRSLIHPTGGGTPTTSSGVTTPRRSIFITFLELMGVGIVAAISYFLYGEAQLIDWNDVYDEVLFRMEGYLFMVLNFPFWLFDVLIDFPLREVYRHGPSILGWEGAPLPRICAQITYHGDESFWSRNLDECERIYEAKLIASMHWRKPIVIGFIILVVFYMIKSIVEARALQRRERIDPNMVETYRAIHMLMRQLKRAANTR